MYNYFDSIKLSWYSEDSFKKYLKYKDKKYIKNKYNIIFSYDIVNDITVYMVRTIFGFPYHYKEVGRISNSYINDVAPLRLELIKGISNDLQKWIENAVKEATELMDDNKSKEIRYNLKKENKNSNKINKLFQEIRKDKNIE